MSERIVQPLVIKYASLQLNYVLHDQYKRLSDLPRITDSHEAVTYLQEHYNTLNNAQEFFTILLLNRANRILALSTVGQGNKHSTIVDISYIATLSLSIGANSIILCHNHPSGNYFPSEPDKELTRKIKAALQLLDIELTDHIILTSDNDLWYSFASNSEI